MHVLAYVCVWAVGVALAAAGVGPVAYVTLVALAMVALHKHGHVHG